ncbi:MAG: hypothetical protein AB9834_23850 [Lentimicrobium sp.]
MEAKHDPESIKYLESRSKAENDELFEAMKLQVKYQKINADNLPELYKEMEMLCVTVEHFIEQGVSKKKIGPKDIDTLINVLKIGKLQLSRPRPDGHKTKDENKITADYIQNLMETLELLKPKNTFNSKPLEGKKVPDRYFALLYQILVYLGKEPQIGDKKKAEIIDFGKRKYGTGQGFYRAIQEIDLLNMTAYVRGLPEKDRGKWKEIIITISGNDADVISWTNKQPN